MADRLDPVQSKPQNSNRVQENDVIVLGRHRGERCKGTVFGGGDSVISVNVIVDRRIHRVIGLNSDSVTRQQAEDFGRFLTNS